MDNNKLYNRRLTFSVVLFLSLFFIIYGCGTKKTRLDKEIEVDESAMIMGSTFVAPFFIRGTSVFSIDGKRISSSDNGTEIQPGEHTIIIQDSLLFLYVVETARAKLRFVAESGHRYRVKVVGVFRKWAWIEDVDSKVVVAGRSPWF